MSYPKGRRAHNWKGGRVTDPRGYVLVFVGKSHPLADVRGYAYEHRLIGQSKAGRALKRGDIVRHQNRAKGDNAASNLTVLARDRFKAVANCACGCGQEFRLFDSSGRPRRYVSGHNLHPRRNARNG